MFKSKIVFVVGAGASKEVGLPVGAELKSKIADKLDIKFENGFHQSSGDTSIVAALRLHISKVGGRDINGFIHEAWKIKDAMPQAISIDNYIDTHQGNKSIEFLGKLSIVQSILEAERHSSLYIDSRNREKSVEYRKLEKTWFHTFFQILSEGVATSALGELFSNVSFVTFNYDRCIEQFLMHAVEDYFDISANDALQLVNTLEIFHPYGMVGKLPGQSRPAAPVVAFGHDRLGHNILEIAPSIKTFTESADEDELQTIQAKISTAQTIVFIGFAFHELNMKLITPDVPSSATRVFATGKGMSKSDCEVVKNEIHEMMQNDPKTMDVQIRNDLTCFDLFSEYRRSISRQ